MPAKTRHKKTRTPVVVQPTRESHSHPAAMNVLTDCSLFAAIAAFSTGVPYAVYLVKQQLQCAAPGIPEPSTHLKWPKDEALWQRAVVTRDMTTLEALHTLCATELLGKRLRRVMSKALGWSLGHTTDIALIDWLYERFAAGSRHCLLYYEYLWPIGTTGSVNVMQWIQYHREFSVNYGSIVLAAAEHGHVEMLQCIHDDDKLTSRQEAMNRAALHGHLNVVTFLHSIPDLVCKPTALTGAARNGHLDVVQFIVDHRTDGDTISAMRAATEHGHVTIVQYLHNAAHPNSDFVPREDLVTLAATNGHLGCLQYFHSRSDYFRFSPRTMHAAAVANHMHIVRWLHENRTEGCRVATLFEADARELHHVVDFLCTHRPMAEPARALARARKEDRTLLAARFEHAAKLTGKTYAYQYS